MPLCDTDFGSEHYRKINGVRVCVLRSGSVLPLEGETRAAFEERLDSLADHFAQLPDVREVEIEIKVQKGKVTQGILHMHLIPELAPLSTDATLTLRPTQRSRRGGRQRDMARARQAGIPLA